MELREIGCGCTDDRVGSGKGPLAGSCKYGDEPASSGATELVFSYAFYYNPDTNIKSEILIANVMNAN
jgi:hypothetical protein